MALDINFSEKYGQGITGIHDAKIGKLMTPLKMYIQGESDALANSKAQKDLEASRAEVQEGLAEGERGSRQRSRKSENKRDRSEGDLQHPVHDRDFRHPPADR